MKIHIVQKGDTLWKIAKKYGVNFEELKKLNSQLSNPDMIMPGMKIKVPTTGGSIKKEAPMGTKPETTINLGVKKEKPIAEQPFAKEKPVPMPMVEAPIKKEAPIKEVPIAKEKPIVKEVPKTPYTPKMPLQIVPEIDINNYYMMNMQNMTVQQPQLPPKPANILPEVKEVPKKEMPIKEVPMKEMPIKENFVPAPPPVEAPIAEMPVQEQCVPMTPVMPGPGFCPPFGGFPMMPMTPYPQMQGMGMPAPGMVPGNPGIAPMTAAAPGMASPYFHDDESSSFMPQLPGMNPAYNPGAMMGAQNPGFQQQMQNPYMDPAAFGQMPAPAGYSQMPAGYGQMPTGMGEMPAGYGQVPTGMGQMPMNYGQMPTGMGQMPMDYGQMPAGMGQMPMDYGQMPTGMGQMPMDYGQMPTGMGQMPMGYGQMPAGYGQMPMGAAPTTLPSQNPGESMTAAPMMPGTMYGNPGMTNPYGMGGQMSYGYPQMGGMNPYGVTDFESPEMMMPVAGSQMPYMQNPYPTQGFPVSTGAMGDCGCGGPVPTPYMGAMPAAESAPAAMPSTFVPPTPPIYSAPYTGPMNVAQPPYMNPYGMGVPGSAPYGMPGYRDESN
ncbi:SafA/ExsA family spore coat assembly protein [Neobacillus drentensis]|uniref:SafA/ExsA family spore coat assembly protein n=1 Tax=Neobacillus drentensis TaxID=220684 RepID=UPI002FFF5A22